MDFRWLSEIEFLLLSWGGLPPSLAHSQWVLSATSCLRGSCIRALTLAPSLDRAVGGRIVGISRNRWFDLNLAPGDKVVQKTPYFDCI